MASVRKDGVIAKDTKVPKSFYEVKVVPAQPFLRIRRTSLTNGAVMLYDGETYVIMHLRQAAHKVFTFLSCRAMVRITFENISPMPVDFLDLNFEDSTGIYEQQILSDGELSLFDTYETEYSLVRRPVLSWEPSSHQKLLPPGKEMTLVLKCFGKPRWYNDFDVCPFVTYLLTPFL